MKKNNRHLPALPRTVSAALPLLLLLLLLLLTGVPVVEVSARVGAGSNMNREQQQQQQPQQQLLTQEEEREANSNNEDDMGRRDVAEAPHADSTTSSSALAGMAAGREDEQQQQEGRGEDGHRGDGDLDLWRRLSEGQHGGRDLNDDDEVSVIVGYKNERGKASVERRRTRLVADNFGKTIGAEAVEIKVSELRRLISDPDVSYVDPDDHVKGSNEAVPYGIDEVQNGPDTEQARASSLSGSSGGGACGRPSALRVAILDSGVDASHEDLPCSRYDNCVGKDFTGGQGGSWNSPESDHGTGVLGVVAAVGRNNLGVMGMVHQPDVCYLIAKVLDADNGGRSSKILEAVQWAIDEGADVFNLSIDGASYSNSGNRLMDEIYNNRGGLVVAAAGNDGDSGYTYPGSYESVLAVGAVGEDLDVVWYSQRNNRLDFVAPGVNVLSTSLAGRSQNTIAVVTAPGGRSVGGTFAERSEVPRGPVSGRLVECLDGNRRTPCPGGGGHVCIAGRQASAAERMGRRCQDGGGVALIVYNEEADQLLNIKLKGGTVNIPVISVTMTDGLKNLLRRHDGDVVSIESEVGYDFSAGTSLAAPHVTGAIAQLWDLCRQCSNRDVEGCLQSTALHLGPSNAYGSGLIQTEDALRCLENICC